MRSFYCNSVSWGMEFRFAEPNDLKALAAIRGTDDNSESYWFNRISGYYHGTHSPQLALTPRVIIIATHDFRVIGFVAGHLARRYDFDGELQWIDTIPDYRGRGIATSLFQLSDIRCLICYLFTVRSSCETEQRKSKEQLPGG